MTARPKEKRLTARERFLDRLDAIAWEPRSVRARHLAAVIREAKDEAANDIAPAACVACYEYNRIAEKSGFSLTEFRMFMRRALADALKYRAAKRKGGMA